jgi:hypothetical protein
MVPEAALEKTEAGLRPVGEGWFVLNARQARWFDTGGRGKNGRLLRRRSPGNEVAEDVGRRDRRT